MGNNELAKRYPYSGTLELTGRCNLNCKMCYVHVDQCRMKELGRSELTTEEWKRVVDEIFDAGTIQLLITGGEPLLRSDFVELYEYIAKKGFFLTLYTNATLISNEVFRLLQKYPPHTIGVTVYGLSEETYQKVCGNSSAYAKAMQGLQRLLTLPSKVEIRTTITKDNIHEAKQIEEFIKSFGKRVTFNINHTLYKSGRGSIACPEEARLTPEQNAEFYIKRFEHLADATLDNPELLSAIRSDLENLGQEEVDLSEEEPKGPWGCMAGWQNYTVAWDGSVLACQLIDAISIDLRNTSFHEVWDLLADLIEVQKGKESCKNCQYNLYCGVCVAARYCETNSIDGNPEYFCKLAKEYFRLFTDSNRDNL